MGDEKEVMQRHSMRCSCGVQETKPILRLRLRDEGCQKPPWSIQGYES